MPIILPVVTANGNTPSYHKVSSITISDGGSEVTVNSWINKDAFDQGLPLAWQDRYVGPAVASIAEAEAALIQPGARFEGGVIVEALSDLELEKVRKKALAEDEMRKRIFAPIQVGAILLDGDKTAQDNLKNKLAEMQARIDLVIATPVELLVWRDADNVTHNWPDLQAYYGWLQGYTVELSARGTMMYRACWAHKAAIDALTDAGEVKAYDVYSDETWALA